MMNSSKNTVLVTGALGLLGRYLCPILTRSGYNVYATARRNVPRDTKNGDIILVDLSFNNFIEKLPPKIDIIIHLAQSSNFRNFPNQAVDVFNVNIQSTALLLDYATSVGAKKFIYASSGGVYGKGSSAFNELEPLLSSNDLGFYLGSKACGEILVQSYSQQIETTIIRPFFIYGVGQKRSMLLPRLFDSIVKGSPIRLSGSQGLRLNPIHAYDAAEAILAATTITKKPIYNLAGPKTYSLKDICNLIGNFLGIQPIFENINSEDDDLLGDIAAMSEDLITPIRKLEDYLSDLRI